MQLEINRLKCQAYGICESLAPQVFRLDDGGYATVRNGGSVAADDVELARLAVDRCPVKAIEVSHDG